MDKRLSVYMKYSEKAVLVQFLRLYVQIILKCVQLEKYMVEIIQTLWNVRVSLSKFWGLVGRDFITNTCTIVAKRS